MAEVREPAEGTPGSESRASAGILRGFAAVLGGRVGTLLVSIIATPFLVRFLGPAGYGDYAFLLSAYGLFMTAVSAGVFDGVRKYIAEEGPSDHWRSAVMGFYLRYGVALLGVFTVLIVTGLATGVVPKALGEAYQVYSLWLLGWLAAEVFFTLARGSLMGLSREHVSEGLMVARRLAWAAGAISLTASGLGVGAVLASHVGAGSLTVLVAFYFLSRHIDVKAILRSAIEIPRDAMLRFGLSNTVLVLLTVSLYHTDIVLLTSFRTSVETGIYKAALLVAEFVWFVPFGIQTILLHSSSRIWHKEQLGEVQSLAVAAFRYCWIVTLYVILWLAVGARNLIPLYFGPDYAGAVLPLHVLLPGVLGFALARPVFALGQGKGQLRPVVAATGAAATVNLMLNLILIPRYGQIGAAVATSIGYSTMLGGHLVAAARLGLTPTADARAIPVLGAGMGAGAMMWALDLWIRSPTLSLLATGVVGLGVYVALCTKFGAVTAEEVRGLCARVSALAGSARRRVAP